MATEGMMSVEVSWRLLLLLLLLLEEEEPVSAACQCAVRNQHQHVRAYVPERAP